MSLHCTYPFNTFGPGRKRGEPGKLQKQKVDLKFNVRPEVSALSRSVAIAFLLPTPSLLRSQMLEKKIPSPP